MVFQSLQVVQLAAASFAAVSSSAASTCAYRSGDETPSTATTSAVAVEADNEADAEATTSANEAGSRAGDEPCAKTVTKVEHESERAIASRDNVVCSLATAVWRGLATLAW